MDNKNLPAFPASGSWNDNQPEIIQVQQEGLTKREYFAGLAMQGLVSQQAPVDRILNESNQSLTKQIAAASIRLADELLKQLEP